MKFMKLGSKPDAFQTEGDNIRYVATELSTDLIVNVVDVKFYLHNPSIFRGWKDSIIVLQTTKSLLQWCEDLKLVTLFASKVAVDTSKVEWSYTYNRRKLPSENGKISNGMES